MFQAEARRASDSQLLSSLSGPARASRCSCAISCASGKAEGAQRAARRTEEGEDRVAHQLRAPAAAQVPLGHRVQRAERRAVVGALDRVRRPGRQAREQRCEQRVRARVRERLQERAGDQLPRVLPRAHEHELVALVRARRPRRRRRPHERPGGLRVGQHDAAAEQQQQRQGNDRGTRAHHWAAGGDAIRGADEHTVNGWLTRTESSGIRRGRLFKF